MFTILHPVVGRCVRCNLYVLRCVDSVADVESTPTTVAAAAVSSTDASHIIVVILIIWWSGVDTSSATDWQRPAITDPVHHCYTAESFSHAGYQRHITRHWQGSLRRYIPLDCYSLKNSREKYLTCSSLKELGLFENVDATTIMDFMNEISL